MFRTVAVVVLACGLAGCVYSIDTAIADEFVRSNATLVGTWISDNDSARVEVTAVEDGRYVLNHRGKDGTQALYGRLGRLGERDVLEVWPKFGDDEDEEWPMGRIVLVLDVRADEIRTWALIADSIETDLGRGRGQFPHLIRKDDVILTAPTATLMTTIAGYFARPGFLAEMEVYRRVKSR